MGLGVQTVCNYVSHDKTIITSKYASIRRITGPWGFDDFRFSPDETMLLQYSFFGKTVGYFDGGSYGKHDGFTDKIVLVDEKKTLLRSESYEGNETLFKQADDLLAKKLLSNIIIDN